MSRLTLSTLMMSLVSMKRSTAWGMPPTMRYVRNRPIMASWAWKPRGFFSSNSLFSIPDETSSPLAHSHSSKSIGCMTMLCSSDGIRMPRTFCWSCMREPVSM